MGHARGTSPRSGPGGREGGEGGREWRKLSGGLVGCHFIIHQDRNMHMFTIVLPYDPPVNKK